jgi:hypothetical protein
MKEKVRRKNAKERILEQFQYAITLTNVQLNEICYRYGARIHELRKEGHLIKKVRVDKGLFAYRYEGISQQNPNPQLPFLE